MMKAQKYQLLLGPQPDQSYAKQRSACQIEALPAILSHQFPDLRIPIVGCHRTEITERYGNGGAAVNDLYRLVGFLPVKGGAQHRIVLRQPRACALQKGSVDRAIEWD
jgi:hypothetical protein